MSRKVIATVVALFACLSLAACGKSQAPLSVGIRNVGTTLLLGAGGKAVVQAPVPPQVVPVKKPVRRTTPPPPPPPAPVASITPTPTPPPSTPKPTPTGPCPPADPLAVPLNPASSTILNLPVEDTYTQRTTGAVTKAGKSVALPETATVEIGPTQTDWTGSYTFDETVHAGGIATTTTYRVVPLQNAAPNQPNGAPTDPGIYIVAISGDGTETFRAADPGMELAQFPINPNHQVKVSATDGTRTMSYTATVKGLVSVDACGTPLAAWQVDLTDGTIADTSIPGPDGTQHFTASYSIGTQYGGIVIASTSEVTGTDGGAPVTRSLTSLPTTEPLIGDVPLPTMCAPPDPSVPVLAGAPDSPAGTLPTGALAYRSNDLVAHNSSVADTRLPWTATWQVTVSDGSTPADTTYSIDRTQAGGIHTRSVYRVVRPGAGSGLSPGLYLVSQSITDKTTFEPPAPGLLLAAFPLSAGATIKPEADDGTVHMSMTVVVGDPAPVATCAGTNLDSRLITITNGSITDTADRLTASFTERLYLGTQFGGLVLADRRLQTTKVIVSSTLSPAPTATGTPTSTGAPTSTPIPTATPTPTDSSTPTDSTTPAPTSTDGGSPADTTVTTTEQRTDTINVVPKDATK